MKSQYLFLIFCAISYNVKAQIDTDRPAYTNSVNTIPAFKFQLEGGLHSSYFSYKSNGSDFNISLPNTMLRYGVSDNAELRLEIPSLVGRSVKRGPSFVADGIELENASLGVKSKIYKGDKLNISGIGSVFFMERYQKWITTPLRFGINASFPFSYALSKSSSIGGTAGLSILEGNTVFRSSLLYGRFLSPKTWVQAEYYNAILYNFGFSPSTMYSVIHNANFSSQFTVSEFCKLDFTLGAQLKNELNNTTIFTTPNLRSQFGFAYLINK